MLVAPAQTRSCGAGVGQTAGSARCALALSPKPAGAKNAPSACYEEVNSQQDRFGHCGNDPKSGYKPCSWP